MTTNMPYGVFRSDRVVGDRFGIEVVNAVLLSGHLDPPSAMDAANRARRADRSSMFRYWVADSQYPVSETFAA